MLDGHEWIDLRRRAWYGFLGQMQVGAKREQVPVDRVVTGKMEQAWSSTRKVG